MNLFEKILLPAWTQLLFEYTSGKTILRSEKDMEKRLKEISCEIANKEGLAAFIGSKKIGDRIVDLKIADTKNRLLVQMKLYHDKADWKETQSMTNTVESDLKFAKGHEDTFVAVIDTIPSTARQVLPFKLNWKTIEIDEKVYKEIYSNINPRTSPKREQKQNILLANGNQI
jgi:hypothetical protein